VFVGRIPSHARERDLEKFFRGFGRIKEINLKNGFGFVEFDDYRDADEAVYELNHKEMLGERVTVELARPTPRSPSYGGSGGGGRRGGFRFRDKYGAPYNTDYRVIVENLSTRANWQDLKDYMRQAGDVTFSQCHKDRMGEGVVDFASESDMRRAIKRLDGTELLGKRLRLTESVRGGRRRSRSRSRSPRRRSRSDRSRSRSPIQSRSSRSPRRSRSPVYRRSRSDSPRRTSPLRRSRSPSRENGGTDALV